MIGRAPHRGGFTLIEVLVVIGIIAVLISIILPALARACDAANRVQCASNLRQIGQAIINYATQNKGWAPLKGGTKQYPYEWHKHTLVNPLMRYGLNLKIMSSPTQELFNPPWDGWPGHDGGQPVWFVNYQYLIGLGDAATVSGGGRWYEDPPTAATQKLGRAKKLNAATPVTSTRDVPVMVVDMNLYFEPDNGFNNVANARWFYANHGLRSRFDPQLVDIRKYVKGSHRLHTDGHVRWALTDELGRNDTQIKITGNVSNARYSHSGDSRPYFW